MHRPHGTKVQQSPGSTDVKLQNADFHTGIARGVCAVEETRALGAVWEVT
jgi:hypothetical protein